MWKTIWANSEHDVDDVLMFHMPFNWELLRCHGIIQRICITFRIELTLSLNRILSDIFTLLWQLLFKTPRLRTISQSFFLLSFSVIVKNVRIFVDILVQMFQQSLEMLVAPFHIHIVLHISKSNSHWNTHASSTFCLRMWNVATTEEFCACNYIIQILCELHAMLFTFHARNAYYKFHAM